MDLIDADLALAGFTALFCASLVLGMAFGWGAAAAGRSRDAWWAPAAVLAVGVLIIQGYRGTQGWQTPAVAGLLAWGGLAGAAAAWARQVGRPRVASAWAASALALALLPAVYAGGWLCSGGGTFQSVSLAGLLAVGATYLARAAAHAQPAVRALYLGVLGLLSLGLAVAHTYGAVGLPRLMSAAALLWLPPIVDSVAVEGDRRFGLHAYGARTLTPLLVMLLTATA